VHDFNVCNNYIIKELRSERLTSQWDIRPSD